MSAPVVFTASYDRTTKILSAVVCAALVIAPFATRNPVVAAISVLVMLLGYAWSPRGYAIEDGALVIRRLIGQVRVPLDTVRQARLAGPDDFRGCVRLWGSGGMFGYYGVFRTTALGRSTWYMTHRRGAVILVADKTILLSPDDRDGFLAALRARAPAMIATGETDAEPLQPTSSRGPWRGAGIASILGGSLGLAGLVVAAGAITYDPGPPAYTLTSDALTIHDRFYPVTLGPDSIDVPAVRVVDVAEEPAWRPTLRVRGFANSHYQSGWFRAVNGEKVRLYRASGRRLALLPPAHEGNAVLLEVENPDRLVKRLRQEWSGR